METQKPKERGASMKSNIKVGSRIRVSFIIERNNKTRTTEREGVITYLDSIFGAMIGWIKTDDGREFAFGNANAIKVIKK